MHILARIAEIEQATGKPIRESFVDAVEDHVTPTHMAASLNLSETTFKRWAQILKVAVPSHHATRDRLTRIA